MHVVGGAAATRRVGGHDLEKWRAEGRRRRRRRPRSAEPVAAAAAAGRRPRTPSVGGVARVCVYYSRRRFANFPNEYFLLFFFFFEHFF